MGAILLQGAILGEVDWLVKRLPGGSWIEYSGYEFYEAYCQGIKVVVSRTKVGILNAAISTMLGLDLYQPLCVINQGTAGAHVREMEIGDIVIGQSAVYLNDMRSPYKGENEGSNALDWKPGPRAVEIEANWKLIGIAREVPYVGRLTVGKIGSGDLFSKEVDRIKLLNEQLGELCEDMETAAVYKVCHARGVPVLGLRIISNNELTQKSYDDHAQAVQIQLQQYIFRLVKALIAKDRR